MSGKKAVSGRYPPKALYDDLESAHGSIAQKPSAHDRPTITTICQSTDDSQGSALASSSNLPPQMVGTLPVEMSTPGSQPISLANVLEPAPVPQPKKLLVDYPLSEDSENVISLSTLPDGNGSERCNLRNPSIHNIKRLSKQNVKILETGREGDIRQGSCEHTPESTRGVRPGAIVALSSSSRCPGEPQDEGGGRVLEQHKENISHFRARRLAEDDTVDDILQTYGCQSPEKSSEQSHDFHMTVYEDAAEACGGNGQECATSDDELHQNVVRKSCSAIADEDAMTRRTAVNTVTQTVRNNGSGPIGREHMCLSETGIFGSPFQLGYPDDLDQYAWSPCPSEDGIDEGNISPLSAASNGTCPPSRRSTVRDNESYLPGSGDAIASFELHVPQQNLAHSLNSNAKCWTASKGVTRDGPISLLANSDVAGDFHVPEHNINALGKSASLRTIGQVSGVVSNGTSSRPMSEAEVTHTLDQMIESTLRRPDSSYASNYVNYNFVTADERDFARRVAASVPHHSAGELATTDPGPGSSHTTSSSSHNDLANDLSGRKGRPGSYKDPSTSLVVPIRAATPPGLFGRRAMTFSDASADTQPSDSRPSDSRLPVTRSNSRLAQAAAAAGVKGNGRLGRALAGSAEQDWVTESDVKANVEDIEIARFEPSTGSSLADNSELESVPPTGHARQYEINLENGGIQQHPPHPRYNHSWSLLKNVQTGSLTMVPDFMSREGNRLPNVNTSFQTPNFTNPGPSPQYQHPTPLSKNHPHPLSSSPQMTPSRIEMVDFDPPIKSTQQKRLERALTSSDFSSMSDNSDKGSPSPAHFKTLGSVFSVDETADVRLQAGAGLTKASQYASSAWLSTLSESRSSEPSLPNRISSFAKMTVLGRKGNLTGTPEGTGAREVGSSLADASSPGADLSSSPPIINSSPAILSNSPYPGPPPKADYPTPLSNSRDGVDALHLSLRGSPRDPASPLQHHVEYASSLRRQDSFGYVINRSMDKSVGSHDASPSNQARVGQRVLVPHEGFVSYPPYAKSSSNPAAQSRLLMSSSPTIDVGPAFEEHVDWLKYLPAIGRSNRRRCSSSESNGKGNDSPLAGKATGLQPTNELCHQKRRSVGTFLKSCDVDPSDLERGAYPDDVKGSNMCQYRPLKHVNSQSPASPSWTANTCVPTPPLDHPMRGPRYLCDRTLHSPAQERDAISPPVARDLSPHLFHIAGKPDAAKKLQHVRYSRMWAIVCIFIPFLGLLYGHGFLDSIMAWQSDGAIRSFRRTEKVAILVYSYTFFGAVLVALSLAMVFVTT
ncbi:MAG: hypothetical protein Q9163_001725 [Psora crenata]